MNLTEITSKRFDKSAFGYKPEAVDSFLTELASVIAVSYTHLDYTFGAMRVTGFTSVPMSARANRTMQHFFVNGRYIK